MGRKAKIMNASEMEQWLLEKGTIPVTEEMKQQPWYKEVSKLPPCMSEREEASVDEDR